MLAAVRRTLPDRLPWSPRIKMWYRAAQLDGSMPAKWQGLTQEQVERELRLINPAREGNIFRVRYDEEVSCRTYEEGGRQIEEIGTPVGTVKTVTQVTEELRRRGLPGRVESYPLQSPSDFRVWEYVVEHTFWDADYEAFTRYDEKVGGSGLPFVSVGDAPFHEFLLKLAGYGSAFYHLADYPREVEDLLGLMVEIQRERLWPIILESPAVFLQHGVHFSSQFTPPHYFRSYLLPYYQELIPLLHERGKYVSMHADNDTSQILELLMECGYDVLECFVTSPMVPLTLEDARRRLGNRVTIWGGLPSVLLSPSTPEEDFRDYVRKLTRVIAPGDAFILGVADNVMPDSLIDRVAWVSDYLEELGQLPFSG